MKQESRRVTASAQVKKDSCQLNRQRSFLGVEFFQGKDFQGENWSDFDPLEFGEAQIS